MRKCKPGTVAIREIKKYQKTFNLLIPKKTFSLLSKEIGQSFTTLNLRYQATGFLALQESAESYMVGIFEDLHKRRRLPLLQIGGSK